MPLQAPTLARIHAEFVGAILRTKVDNHFRLQVSAMRFSDTIQGGAPEANSRIAPCVFCIFSTTHVA